MLSCVNLAGRVEENWTNKSFLSFQRQNQSPPPSNSPCYDHQMCFKRRVSSRQEAQFWGVIVRTGGNHSGSSVSLTHPHQSSPLHSGPRWGWPRRGWSCPRPPPGAASQRGSCSVLSRIVKWGIPNIFSSGKMTSRIPLFGPYYLNCLNNSWQHLSWWWPAGGCWTGSTV